MSQKCDHQGLFNDVVPDACPADFEKDEEAPLETTSDVAWRTSCLLPPECS